MAGEHRTEDAWPIRAHRQEQPELEADDLRDEPHGLEPPDHAAGEADKLDAGKAHHQRAPDLQPVGQMQDRLALDHRRPRILGRQIRRIFEAEIAIDLAERRRRHQPADHPLAPRVLPLASPRRIKVGLQAIDAHRVLRQPPPDRQQQAGDDMEAAGGERRNLSDLSLPCLGEGVFVRFLPLRMRQGIMSNRAALHRSQEAHPALDRAIITHQPRSRQLHGGPAGTGVDQELRSRVTRPFQRFLQGHGLVAVLALDLEDPGLGAGGVVGVHRPPLGDHQALGGHGLDADIISARCDRPLDRGGQQILEHGEEVVLQRDLQRQQAVEEGGDRRQVFLERAVATGDLQAGRLLERLQ